MKMSVSDAKAQLTELVRLAEAGEDVVLTRHGVETVRLVRVVRPHDQAAKRAKIEAVMAAAEAKALPGPMAARSQDLLYDENGLPA